MRNPTFCICENKDADQLRGNREADQRLCFRYIAIQNFTPLAIFCDCTARFVSDLVGNQNVGFLMTRLLCNHATERYKSTVHEKLMMSIKVTLFDVKKGVMFELYENDNFAI